MHRRIRRTYETEHVDEGRQRRDDETVPASMALVEQRVHGVARQARDCEVRHVSEGKLVVPKTRQYTTFNTSREAYLLLRLLLILAENVLICRGSPVNVGFHVHDRHYL